MKNLEKLLLKFVVVKGRIIDHESYYGGRYGTSEAMEKTKNAQIDVDKFLNQIDWKKTKAPQTDSHEQFAGTYVDYCDYIHSYGTTIVLKNGEKQKWEVDIGSGSSFGEVLEEAFKFILEEEKDGE